MRFIFIAVFASVLYTHVSCRSMTSRIRRETSDEAARRARLLQARGKSAPKVLDADEPELTGIAAIADGYLKSNPGVVNQVKDSGLLETPLVKDTVDGLGFLLQKYFAGGK